jgi:hypothetical protein
MLLSYRGTPFPAIEHARGGARKAGSVPAEPWRYSGVVDQRRQQRLSRTQRRLNEETDDGTAQKRRPR